HFYVDHPHFLEQPWRLPSRCENRSPVSQGAPGGRHCAFTRLLNKPFALSEYNYSGPGRFRGVGGILTGCMAALQDWSVVWRFAYGHTRDTLFQPGAAGYFDMVSDPLNQAAERASLCLFLRGDMRPARHSIGVAMTEKGLLDEAAPTPSIAPAWHSLALLTRVGTFVGRGKVPADLSLPATKGATSALRRPAPIAPYSPEAGDQIFNAIKKRGWLRTRPTTEPRLFPGDATESLANRSRNRGVVVRRVLEDGNVTDLLANRLQSETGELLIDAPRDVLVLNTPNTAGCYAPAGETVTAGPVTITIEDTPATVWVSSLDGKPITRSKRLLITHLTDLQNTGARFGERARQTLLEWGKLPHLVRAGRATVKLHLSAKASPQVWALAINGRRIEEVESERKAGVLTIPLSVKGEEGARILYEVADRAR
ncbi:MAG: hypothetical protein HY318_18705, partial [Armatimonadetes bacterium]|nr:hypothetical protein [Armatimonadota bacterium]